MKLEIVFENENFLAVDKPSGVLSVPGRMGGADPRPCLSKLLIESGRNVLPVHRLDEEVSGLVLFAKNTQAHRVANGWFERREVRKTYEAWTEGQMLQDWPVGQAREWHSKLLRGKKRAYESPHGKEAVTIATWLGEVETSVGRWRKWNAEPRTGRSHQLRYELAKNGFPIVGDTLYGAKEKFPVPGAIALRAVKLDFSGCADATNYGLPPVINARGLDAITSVADGR